MTAITTRMAFGALRARAPWDGPFLADLSAFVAAIVAYTRSALGTCSFIRGGPPLVGRDGPQSRGR